MSLALRMQKTVLRLLNKHGANLAIAFKDSVPQREPGKPWRGSTGLTTVTVRGVQYSYDNDEVPGATRRHSDTRFIIPEVTATGAPQFGAFDLVDAVSITDTSNNVWSIDNIEIIEPGDDRVAYILFARRG